MQSISLFIERDCTGGECTVCPQSSPNNLLYMKSEQIQGIVSQDCGVKLRFYLSYYKEALIFPRQFFFFVSVLPLLRGASFLPHNASKDEYSSGDSNSLADPRKVLLRAISGSTGIKKRKAKKKVSLYKEPTFRIISSVTIPTCSTYKRFGKLFVTFTQTCSHIVWGNDAQLDCLQYVQYLLIYGVFELLIRPIVDGPHPTFSTKFNIRAKKIQIDLYCQHKSHYSLSFCYNIR